jgi:hypothetical protein
MYLHFSEYMRQDAFRFIHKRNFSASMTQI